MAGALAADGVHTLLQRVQDDAGGPAPRAVGAGLLALFAVLAARTWMRLERTPRAPDTEA